MIEGKNAVLQARQMLLAGSQPDNNNYHCCVYKYDERAEYIYLQLQGGGLSEINLDAVYECVIRLDEHNRKRCIGIVKERYLRGSEKILKLAVTDGFYQDTKEQ